MNNALAVLSLLLASTCQSAPPKPSPAPAPTQPAPTGDCAAACAHLAELGCPEAQPTPKGASCVAVCENASDDGSPISFQTDCVVRAATCADANACQAL